MVGCVERFWGKGKACTRCDVFEVTRLYCKYDSFGALDLQASEV